MGDEVITVFDFIALAFALGIAAVIIMVAIWTIFNEIWRNK